RSLWQSRVFSVALDMFHTGIRLIGLQDQGRRNALDVQLATRSFFFSNLPSAFDGYRILHLSDTHFDCLTDLAPVAARLLDGAEVDLLVLTGDVHGHHRAPLAASTRPLADLIRAVCVKDCRFAVLGNHDPADMAAALDELGFEVLINQSAILTKR